MTDKPFHPPGSPEALAEYRKIKAEIDAKLNKGRKAILEAEFDDWPRASDVPSDDEGDDDGEDGAGGGGGGEDATPGRRYRGIRLQRIGPDGQVFWCGLGLPEDCPVTPLGRDGKVFFFLTPEGQLVSYEDGKFGKSHITGLFASRLKWVIDAFPAINAQGVLTGFKADMVQMAMFAAAAHRGVFDAREKVRGLGCWKGPEGQLIQHLGDVVLIDGKRHEPGVIGEHVYPGRPAVPPPVEAGPEVGQALYGDLLTWNWARGNLDVRLLLGWIGCAILGAALDWRPMVFITGDAGSGKSSVQERLKKLLPGRLASTVDATPAALRQIVNQDAIGVSFDEIEADANDPRGTDVMKLARVAASGGTTYRGGKEHSAAEFTLRGCFAFSAIVPPSMRAQDLQRLTFLRLGKLPKGGRMADMSDATLKRMGQQIAGRIAAGWPRWAETLRAYEEGLERIGHNQRGAKQFGTLMAACDLILGDAVPGPAEVDNLVRGLERDSLYEYESADPTWLLVWRHILSAQPEVWRNVGSPNVAEVIRDFLDSVVETDTKAAQRKLNRAGLAVVKDRKRGEYWLAIPARHQQIAAMFRGSDFQAHGGEGTWTTSLRGAERWNEQTNTGVYRTEAVPQLGRVKCTLVRLSAEVELGGRTVPIFDRDPDKISEE